MRSLRSRLQRFLHGVYTETPFVKMLTLLVLSWLVFSSLVYLFEGRVAGSPIESYGEALYWGVAAFSTAGIADVPRSGAALLLGGVWIVLGSALFFGTIVATITTYFMRPLRRPVRQIVDAIEYNLEQLDELSIEELEVLKRTTDALIGQMEQIRRARHEP
jgi:voltage-gated potassium channel